MKSLTEKVDALFAEWDKPDSPGCALGIIHNGQLVYKRGYGMADLEHDVPISSTSVFRIGSTSKQFTAMCIALLAEQGKILLDDDIRRYVPEMPEYEHTITIRHLVHHTSGLRDYLVLMSLAGMREEDFYTDDQVLEMIARQKELNFVPGDEYLYSNSGYYVLGVIVKRVSGQSLRQFAEENIFKPLGMEHTHFHDDHNEIVKHRAAGYAPREGDQEDGGYRINMTTLDMVGDGGVFTTVEDLLLWDQNFYDNKLGRGGEELIQQVLTPATLNDGKKLDYAFGLAVEDYKGSKMVSHGGAFVGFRADMLRFPEHKFSVICLANLSTHNPSRLARQVADVCLADQLEEDQAKAEFIELSEGELEDKTGVYQSATSGTIVELFVQEDKLMAEVFGYSFELKPVSDTEFQAVDAPVDARVKFEKQEPEGPRLVHLLIESQAPDTLEEIEVVSPGADRLTEYVGDYCSDELQVTYKFVLEDGKLYVRHNSAPQDPLKPGLDDMFRVSSIAFHFARDDEGQVSGFAVNAGRVRNIRFLKLTN